MNFEDDVQLMYTNRYIEEKIEKLREELLKTKSYDKCLELEQKIRKLEKGLKNGA